MKDGTHIDIDRVLVEELNEAERAHLSGCAMCSEALGAVRGDFAGLRHIDESLAQVPETFWDAQRRAIRVRAEQAKPKSTFTGAYAWAGAAVAALVVAGSMFSPTAEQNVSPQPTHQEELSDAALLQSVQDQLENYPEALHPAQVMYTEMASAKGASAARK